MQSPPGSDMSDAITDIEGLLAGRVGLRLDPSLRGRLARCVQEEADAAGLTLVEYASSVTTAPEAFQRLLNRITVQQTEFFRDQLVFDAIATHVLPSIGEPVFAWSAGCANGQETYSLAMLFAESHLRNWSVLGTDISTKALNRAASGVYSETEVANIDIARRAAHMTRTGSRWQVRNALRDRVHFQFHNLISDPLPTPLARCQIILCRNVLIYFSSGQLAAVLDRLASWLHPDGYLFLGASESLWQLTDRFQLARVGGAFAYRLGHGPPERRRDDRAVGAERRRPPTVSQLLAAGEAAANAKDFSAAAEHFRRATFLDPEHPMHYFQLALCLERAGQYEAARRALSDARHAIDRGDTSLLEAALEGFRPEELLRAIDARLGIIR